MTADVTASEPFAAVGPLLGLSRRRVSIGFLNWAHALDHFVMLVYPTVVIELQAVYGRSYSELIGLSTASFIAFGLFSLPAGWLADRWSRRNMMVAFYLGCGASLIGAALAPSLVGLAIALFVLGIFAAIYHPVGTAMVIESATHRGRNMAFNGVCGNRGISLAAGITAILTAALWWRGAFFVPGIVCIATGIAYVWVIPDEEQHKSARSSTADVPLSAASRRHHLRPVHRGRAGGGIGIQHAVRRAAKDRRRARQRHFAGRDRRADHSRVHLRSNCADGGRTPGRALSAAYSLRRAGRHAVLGAWCGPPMRAA
jgi:MFS family permease